jgi:hypothetical protein
MFEKKLLLIFHFTTSLALKYKIVFSRVQGNKRTNAASWIPVHIKSLYTKTHLLRAKTNLNTMFLPLDTFINIL